MRVLWSAYHPWTFTSLKFSTAKLWLAPTGKADTCEWLQLIPANILAHPAAVTEVVLENGHRLIRASHTQFILYGHNNRLCYIQRDFSCINIDFTINHNKWCPFLFVVEEKSPVWFISTSCPETPYQPRGVMKETWLKSLFMVTCDLHIISVKINNFVTMQFSLETVE